MADKEDEMNRQRRRRTHRQPIGQAPFPANLSYDPELQAGHYIHVPGSLIRSEGLSAHAKVLYLVLYAYAAAGSRTLPHRTRLAQECGCAESNLDDALDELTDVGLLSVDLKQGSTLHLYATTSIDRLPPLAAIHAPSNEVHIPLAQNNPQVKKDTQLLVEKLGINEETAESLAQLAANRGRFVGYVAEVVQYATTMPGIKNPAGYAVELIRRNERRMAAAHIQQQAQETRPGLDPEKYTSGKYAFLFRPRGEESTEADSEYRAEERDKGEPKIGWEGEKEGDEL